MEIVPSEVSVGSVTNQPTTFELEARMWMTSETERWSAKHPEEYDQVKWTEDRDWISLVSTTDNRAIFSVIPGAASTDPATVKVSAGFRTATAKVTLAGPGSASEDVITAEYTPDKAPAAAIVNGVPASDPGNCATTTLAFVRRALIPDLESECSGKRSGWDAVVLDPTRRPAFLSVGWSYGTNRVDAAARQDSPLDIPVALRIMVFDPKAATAEELEAHRAGVLDTAQNELRRASELLSESRAGITISEYDTRVIPVSQTVSIGTCAEGEHQTSTYDVERVLHVYYLDDINRLAGLTCSATETRPRDVIYVAVNMHSPTTFIHELGHALGLMLPLQGHSDVLGGFDGTNIMTSGDVVHDPVGRHRFTVGQVFRMHADSTSWLNRGRNALGGALRPPGDLPMDCHCGVAGPPLRCPSLEADLAEPSNAKPSIGLWACSDQIWFTKLPGTDPERPVVLAAGRSGRVPPGKCITDVPGFSEVRSNAIYAGLANLSEASGCPNWAALFFARHRPLYLQPGLGWLSANSDELPSWGIPPAPAVIQIRAYYPASEATTVEQDRVYTARVFGEANRAGIDLDFETHPSAACPAATPTIRHEVILCYTIATAQVPSDEADVTGHRIEVYLGNWVESTVAHALGRALGLDELPGADPKFPDNIMHKDPLQRGEKLTLGQVFRLQGSLSTAWPKCDPGPCPSLEADVP